MKNQAQLTADALELATGVQPTIEGKGRAFLFSIKNHEEAAKQLWAIKPYLMGGVGVDFIQRPITEQRHEDIETGGWERDICDNLVRATRRRYYDVIVGHTKEIEFNTTDREPRVSLQKGALHIPKEAFKAGMVNLVFKDALKDGNTRKALQIFLSEEHFKRIQESFDALEQIKRPSSEELIVQPALATAFSKNARSITAKVNRSLSGLPKLFGNETTADVRRLLAGNNYSLLTATV